MTLMLFDSLQLPGIARTTTAFLSLSMQAADAVIEHQTNGVDDRRIPPYRETLGSSLI